MEGDPQPGRRRPWCWSFKAAGRPTAREKEALVLELQGRRANQSQGEGGPGVGVLTPQGEPELWRRRSWCWSFKAAGAHTATQEALVLELQGRRGTHSHAGGPGVGALRPKGEQEPGKRRPWCRSFKAVGLHTAREKEVLVLEL